MLSQQNKEISRKANHAFLVIIPLIKPRSKWLHVSHFTVSLKVLVNIGTILDIGYEADIGTMTGWGRELADMMERWNVDILCLQETKWKDSEARNIGGGCKLLYNGADGRKNGIGIVVREELVER